MAIQLPYTGVTTNETIPAPYTNGLAAIDLSLKEDKASKGIANGYAPLDGSAKVPVVNLTTNMSTMPISPTLPRAASTCARPTGTIMRHQSAR